MRGCALIADWEVDRLRQARMLVAREFQTRIVLG